MSSGSQTIGRMQSKNEHHVEFYHTIAICTANRKDIACATLTDLFSRIVFQSQTEIIVVNNGPEEDGTYIREHLRQVYLDSEIPWSVYHEPTRGVSHARNLALDNAKGDIISFLDDDASPSSSEWQEAVLNVFSTRSEVALCGGPTWLVPPVGSESHPWWRSSTTDIYFSCLYEYPVGYCPPGLIAGLNASYRMSAIGPTRFKTRLGWSNGRALPLAGEETLFNEHVCIGGWKAWFEDKAIVLHRIEPERYHAKWLLKRAFMGGKTEAVFEVIHGRKINQVHLEAFKRILKAGIKAVVNILRGQSSGCFSELCAVSSKMGVLSTRDIKVE